MPRVLAVSSSGGHWVQLLRLSSAWTNCDTAYVTTESSYRSKIYQEFGTTQSEPSNVPRFYSVRPASGWNKIKLLQQLCQVFLILIKERPDIVISTGATVGFFALVIAKALGGKTIWVDSIANAQKISRSGELVSRWADLYLTQWEHLEGTKKGLRFLGSVL